MNTGRINILRGIKWNTESEAIYSGRLSYWARGRGGCSFMRWLIKRLAIAATVIWIALFAKEALANPWITPTTQEIEQARELSIGSEVYGILRLQCQYKPSECGYSPSVAPPPRKPI